MTETTITIRDSSGNVLYSFDPVPSDATYRLDNGVGKVAMDLPSYHRPNIYTYSSSTRQLTIKTVLLGTDFTSSTILDKQNLLLWIMSGASTDSYLQITIPANENLVGAPKTYAQSDSDLDANMFATGNNYFQVFVHPDTYSVDKITRNMWYVTLQFSEVSLVTVIG